MNAVLSYAIDHQGEVRAIFVSDWAVRGDDLEDAVQEVLVRVWQADPADRELGDVGHRAYCRRVIRSVAISLYRRRRPLLPLIEGRRCVDQRLGPESLVLLREEIREAWAAARPSERRAIWSRLHYQRGQDPHADRTKVGICNLKRRLREAAPA